MIREVFVNSVERRRSRCPTETGYVDMHRAIRLYRESGFRAVFIDDHVPMVAADTEFPGNLGCYRGRMYALAYIQALIDGLR